MANFFHSSAKISLLSSIEISSRGSNTTIGENSVIDDFVKIKHVGGEGNVVLGHHVFINSGTVIYSGNGIIIGNNVLIGPNCNLMPVNHEFNEKNKLIRLQGFQTSKGGIIIEDDVWLGANVTILDGAIIRRGCVIGANTLIYGDTQEYCVYVGNPGEKIKERK